jgi:hypothetical protein
MDPPKNYNIPPKHPIRRQPPPPPLPNPLPQPPPPYEAARPRAPFNLHDGSETIRMPQQQQQGWAWIWGLIPSQEAGSRVLGWVLAWLPSFQQGEPPRPHGFINHFPGEYQEGAPVSHDASEGSVDASQGSASKQSQLNEESARILGIHEVNGETVNEVLGISIGSTLAQQKKAYRNLMLRWHPDKNLGNPTAEVVARKLNEVRTYLDSLDGGTRKLRKRRKRRTYKY